MIHLTTLLESLESDVCLERVLIIIISFVSQMDFRFTAINSFSSCAQIEKPPQKAS
jgi:hypothetical protein